MAIKPIEILIRARDEAGSILTGVQAKVTAVAAAVTTLLGAGLFAGAVRSAADLEAAMSRVEMATGATAGELQELRQAAEDAGASTKYTSVEAAGALENLAKAGLNAKDSIAALPAVLALAQAGDIGLAESAEYVTKSVMGMGLAFTDAGRVADVLAMGANASNTSVVGLAQALSYAAPVARSLGLSLETTVAIIGKFADAGIDASRAGTALNSILSQFSDPTSKFRQELGAAGIVTTNFEQALRELAEAGPRGQKAINAVGMEAGPALRALLGQGMGALDDLKRKLDESAGSAAAAAKVMEDNLKGSFNGLSSAWDTVKTTLGTPVLPVLKDAVDQLAGSLRGLVTDGTVGKFGEAIATAFQSGVKWARDFLAQVNFTQIATDMRAFADRANEVFTQIGEYASTAGNSVKLAYGVMSAGVNVVLTAVYGIGSVFAEVASVVMTGVAKLRDGLASVTFGALSDSFKLAAEDARSAAQGFGDAAQAMRDRAAGALQATADAAQLARDGFGGLADTVGAGTQRVDTASKAIADMAKQIEEAGAKTAAATKATADKAAADERARQAAEDNRAAIAQLREEYSALVAGGSLQAAAEKLQEINKVMSAAPEAAKGAEEAAARVEQAYRNLGMKTGQELAEAADLARGSFDALTAAGVKSASTLRQAFETYARAEMDLAERQGAAAVATAQRMLAAKASAAGLAFEVDASGKVIVRSMQDAKKATDDVNDSARSAAGGYRDMAGAAAQAAAKAKALQQIYDKHRLDDGKDKYKVGDGSDLVGKSRDIRYAAVNETDIDAQIVKRYGEEMLDDPLTKEAWTLRLQLDSYRKNYGNARSAQSLQEQANIMAALERVEREIERRRVAKERERKAKEKGESSSDSPSGSPSDSGSDRGPRSSGVRSPGGSSDNAGIAPGYQGLGDSSGSGSGGGGNGVGVSPDGPTFISNVTIPGLGSAQFEFPDSASQQRGTDLLRRLAAAKRTANR